MFCELSLEETTIKKLVIFVIVFSQIVILGSYFIFPSSQRFTSSIFRLETESEIQVIALAPNEREFAIGDVSGNISIYDINGSLLSSIASQIISCLSLQRSPPAGASIIILGGMLRSIVNVLSV